MSITRSPIRPIVVDVKSVYVAAAVGAAAVVVAGVALAWQQPAQPLPLPAASVRPVPVYDATGAMLNVIVPSSAAGAAAEALSSQGYSYVDSTTASQLAAEHPWAPAQANVSLSSQGYSSVDGSLASQLAAEHPWAPAAAIANLSSQGYAYVDGTTASQLAAEHPWTVDGIVPVYDATAAMLDAIQ